MDQAGPAGDGEMPAGQGDRPAVPASSLAVTEGEQGEDTTGSGSPAADPPATEPPAADGPASGYLWSRSPVLRHIVVLAGFLAAGVVFTWPRATYLYQQRLPDTRDAASFVWGFWWVAHQVTHLSNPWYTHYLAAPVGTQLGFHTLMPLPGLIMTPVTLITHPSVSYNLLSVLTPGLLAYAMYRAARLWVPSQAGAIAAGALYGLSSMLTNDSWYELNLAMGALFIPLGIEAAVRLRRRPGWRQALYLGAVVGAALLTDQESAILATIVVACTLLPWLVAGLLRRSRDGLAGKTTVSGRDRVRELLLRVRALVLAVAVLGVVASPQIIAMIAQTTSGGASFPPQQLAFSYTEYGVGLAGLVSPSPRLASWGLDGAASFYYHHGIVNPYRNGHSSALQASYVPMFGVTLTILAFVGLIVAWRRRNAWYLALLTAGCALLALGPELWIGGKEYIPDPQTWDGIRVSLIMPYTWLVRLPGLSNFREASRFAEVGLAGAALLAACVFDWLRRHTRAVLAVVAVLSLFELGWAGNPPATVMPAKLRIGSMPASYPLLDRGPAADHSSSIVVDFPFGIRGGPPIYGPGFAPASEVLASTDGHPLADGLISRVPKATINGIVRHPFYYGLNATYHQQVATNPGGWGWYRELEKDARKDAAQMNVGWVIVWPTRVPRSINMYLVKTGFKLAYHEHGVQVYHRVTPRRGG